MGHFFNPFWRSTVSRCDTIAPTSALPTVLWFRKSTCPDGRLANVGDPAGGVEYCWLLNGTTRSFLTGPEGASTVPPVTAVRLSPLLIFGGELKKLLSDLACYPYGLRQDSIRHRRRLVQRYVIGPIDFQRPRTRHACAAYFRPCGPGSELQT